MPLFQRFVQPGRLCLVQYGPDEGKLCVIVDIIDQKRVLVDGAGITGVARQAIPIQRIALTDQKLKISRGLRTGTLKSALKKDDIISKFNQTTWGKKLKAKTKRAHLTDFERFELMVAKKTRKQLVKEIVAK